VRSGLVIRSSSALSRAYISMDARYPLPSWPANTHPNRQLVIACTIALTRNTMTHVGGASRSSVSKFQAGAFAVNAAMLAAKTGAAVSAARSISPSTRERRKYTHSIRHRRPGRDGPIKYPRDRPIFEPSAPQAEHSPSDLAFRPFDQSQRADRADKACAPGHGKGCGSPVLKLWNESRTNRARIADSVVVGIRSRPYLVAQPLHATKSCKRSKRREPSDAEMD
jgi:hypothetical protein